MPLELLKATDLTGFIVTFACRTFAFGGKHGNHGSAETCQVCGIFQTRIWGGLGGKLWMYTGKYKLVMTK